MAITNLNYTASAGINYSVTTDNSTDWPSVPLNTYFYDIAQKRVYYKSLFGDITTFGSLATLSTVALKFSIDFKTASGTNILLFTAGATRFMPQAIQVHYTNISLTGATIAPAFNVGWISPDYNQWCNSTLPITGIVNNNFGPNIIAGATTNRTSSNVNTFVYCRIVTATNAATYTGTLVITGCYL